MTGQQLKNSILQMAVQGKLVPQDPNDEPASVLLERIRKEKEQLIKEGKIKKEKNPSYIFRGADNLPYEKVGKNEPVCIADEVPFEIPESWEWVRLGNIFQHNTGKALNASNRTGSLLPYITTSNLYWDRFELGNLREMYFSENEIEKCTATKGDLLVCEGGDIGRAAIWMFDEDIRIQNHIHKLRSYTEVCTEFFYYLFYLYKHAGWIGGKGIGIQGLSANALQYVIPFLPENLDAPVVLVQHMPEGFTASLSTRLDELSRINVKEACDGDVLQKGTVYIAKGGSQMRVKKSAGGYMLSVTVEAARNGLKPCADIMYESLMNTGFEEIICVVMTGMGADGTQGILQLEKTNKIYVIGQDAESCTVYGMPKAIADAGAVDEVVSLKQIADAITKHVGVR